MQRCRPATPNRPEVRQLGSAFPTWRDQCVRPNLSGRNFHRPHCGRAETLRPGRGEPPSWLRGHRAKQHGDQRSEVQRMRPWPPAGAVVLRLLPARHSASNRNCERPHSLTGHTSTLRCRCFISRLRFARFCELDIDAMKGSFEGERIGIATAYWQTMVEADA